LSGCFRATLEGMSLGDSLRRRAAHVPMPIRVALMAGVVALTAYWWASYSGLYRWLAEWQLARSGSYEVQLTGVVTLLALLVPALVIIAIIGAGREGERGQAHADGLVAAEKARRERTNAWLREHRRRLTFLLAGVALTGVGAFTIGSGLLAGERVQLDAAALEGGGAAPGRYVDLTGRILAADAVAVSSSHGRDTVYLPVVSAPGAPVRVYLKTPLAWVRSHRREIASGRYEGLLDPQGLPGVAVTAFTQRGHPPAESYWVLEHLETPARKIAAGRFTLLLGLAMTGVAALVWWIKARRARTS
jgi:hypothetical protein